MSPLGYFRNIKVFADRHQRHIPTAALVAGFLWDIVTLGRPDQLFDNMVLLFYLVLAGVGIGLINYRQERGRLLSLPLLVLVQFSFGNLASALFVFYGKSGTFVENWPFLLVFVVLLIGNEFSRGHYYRLLFHVGIYYLMLFAYTVLIIPVLARSVGVEIFLASGIVSLVLMAGFLGLLYLGAPQRIAVNRIYLMRVVAGIFIGFNVFYFANLIPPVPLSLKDVAIYHYVERTGPDQYLVSYEEGKWYEFWKRSDRVFHFESERDSAYCFSSVFAPARIATPIYHRWEYYDDLGGSWETVSRISFPIVGGRDGGFRGYSVKSALTAGKWRCSVETERGALIGRVGFSAVRSEAILPLITEFR
jgi:hypothetical protein